MTEAFAHSSTVVREAAQFGFPSVITSDYGAELHPDLILKVVAIAATDSQAIVDAVGRLSAQCGPRPAIERARASPLAIVLEASFPRPAAS